MSTAPPDLPALDELGRRLELAAARHVRGRTASSQDAARDGGVPRGAGRRAGGGLDDRGVPPAQLDRGDAAASGRSGGSEDPVATGSALDRLGIDVRWSLIEDNPGGKSPTKARIVAAPPAGTHILSIAAADGSPDIPSDARLLRIEIAPVGSKILESHR